MERESLTECELLVMNIVWGSDVPLDLKAVTERAEQLYHKDWKQQTVSTFLSRALKKGYLTMERKGRVFIYYPVVSKEEYKQKEVGRFMDFWSDGKVGELFASLVKEKKLTEEEKEDIRRLLDVH